MLTDVEGGSCHCTGRDEVDVPDNNGANAAWTQLIICKSSACYVIRWPFFVRLVYLERYDILVEFHMHKPGGT